MGQARGTFGTGSAEVAQIPDKLRAGAFSAQCCCRRRRRRCGGCWGWVRGGAVADPVESVSVAVFA